MPRLAVIVLTFVASLALAGGWLVKCWGAGAAEEGIRLYPHRHLLWHVRAAQAQPPPTVVWIGDSTIIERPGLVTYPRLVEQQMLAPLGLRTVVISTWGIDGYAEYALAHGAARLRPEQVVLVANLRLMRKPGSTRGFSDLLQLVPARALPELLALPYSTRGMSAPRLVLAHLLGTPQGERGFYVLEGLRSLFQQSDAWHVLGPEEPPRDEGRKLRTFFRSIEASVRAYDLPLGPGAPMVRFTAGAVRAAASNGAQVLVVVSPVPTAELARMASYDPVRFASRVGVLREAVERAGGRLLDLHDALPPDMFADLSGHFTPAGSARVASLVGPVIAENLAARHPGMAQLAQDFPALAKPDPRPADPADGSARP